MSVQEKFVDYCHNGHLEMAKQLLFKNPDIDISAYDEQAFRLSCQKGQLEVAKWLFSIKPNIDISSRNEKAFRWSCFNGYLDITRWLLSIKPDIDISIDFEDTFRWTYENGNLDMTKWLLQETIKRGNKVFEVDIPDELNIHTEYVCIKNYPEKCLECTTKYNELSLELIGNEDLAREITKYIIY